MRLLHTISIFALVAFVSFGSPVRAEQQVLSEKSVLIVLSSAGKGHGKTRPGFEMDELAQAWSIFRSNGIQTTFASPRGGVVEADKFDPADSDIAELLANRAAVAELATTLSLSQVDSSSYDAIYVVGGKGAMFDLATDSLLSRLISTMYDQGMVVATICHGSAALANVILDNGKYLVDGRAVTGFTAEEEAIFGKKWIQSFPFQIEAKLRERGGIWVESSLMMPGVAVDNRLVTGQNPYSTTLVANAVLRSLGVEPVARKPRKDEASLALIELAVNGDPSAAAILAAAPKEYQPELIAIIGHYQLQAARDEDQVRAALAAMDLAAPHYKANELSVSRANALWRLGKPAESAAILEEVLAKVPDMEEALELQKNLQRSR